MNPYQVGDWRDTEIHVHRAGAIGEQHVPTLAILAHDEMPEHTSLEEARAVYLEEGARVADALIQHLAGGVLDQILVRLLEHRASLLCIATPEQARR